MDNLYLLNGTWYIVTDNPSDFPLLRMMTSTGGEIWNDEQSITDRCVRVLFCVLAKPARRLTPMLLVSLPCQGTH